MFGSLLAQLLHNAPRVFQLDYSIYELYLNMKREDKNDIMSCIMKYNEIYNKGIDTGHIDGNECFKMSNIDSDHKLSWLKLGALLNNSNCQCELGIHYYDGNGTSMNTDYAAELFMKSAYQGNDRGQCRIGVCYWTGHGVGKNEKLSIDWLTKSARQGNSVACYNLGYAHEYGSIKNYKFAVKWYEKGAELGNSDAQNKMGILYRNGKYVERDEKKAFVMFTTADKNGHNEATYNLGVCFRDGIGTPVDGNAAVNIFTNLKNADGQCGLAICYMRGIGVSVNNAKAIELFERSAEQDNLEAQYFRGYCYEIAKEDFKAINIYLKLVSREYPLAQNKIGICYRDGNMLPPNNKSAIEYLTKASKQGCSEAHYNLGICYRDGLCVSEDKRKAVELFMLAHNSGHALAQTAINGILDAL